MLKYVLKLILHSWFYPQIHASFNLGQKILFSFSSFFFKNKYLKREMLSDPRSGWKDVVGNGYDQNTLYTCMKYSKKK